eukprot:COSAG01_NODE_121_length_25291_cov_10.011670_2_plen_4872_part_00
MDGLTEAHLRKLGQLLSSYAERNPTKSTSTSVVIWNWTSEQRQVYRRKATGETVDEKPVDPMRSKQLDIAKKTAQQTKIFLYSATSGKFFEYPCTNAQVQHVLILNAHTTGTRFGALRLAPWKTMNKLNAVGPEPKSQSLNLFADGPLLQSSSSCQRIRFIVSLPPEIQKSLNGVEVWLRHNSSTVVNKLIMTRNETTHCWVSNVRDCAPSHDSWSGTSYKYVFKRETGHLWWKSTDQSYEDNIHQGRAVRPLVSVPVDSFATHYDMPRTSITPFSAKHMANTFASMCLDVSQFTLDGRKIKRLISTFCNLLNCCCLHVPQHDAEIPVDWTKCDSSHWRGTRDIRSIAAGIMEELLKFSRSAINTNMKYCAGVCSALLSSGVQQSGIWPSPSQLSNDIKQLWRHLLDVEASRRIELCPCHRRLVQQAIHEWFISTSEPRTFRMVYQYCSVMPPSRIETFWAEMGLQQLPRAQTWQRELESEWNRKDAWLVFQRVINIDISDSVGLNVALVLLRAAPSISDVKELLASWSDTWPCVDTCYPSVIEHEFVRRLESLLHESHQSITSALVKLPFVYESMASDDILGNLGAMAARVLDQRTNDFARYKNDIVKDLKFILLQESVCRDPKADTYLEILKKVCRNNDSTIRGIFLQVVKATTSVFHTGLKSRTQADLCSTWIESNCINACKVSDLAASLKSISMVWPRVTEELMTQVVERAAKCAAGKFPLAICIEGCSEFDAVDHSASDSLLMRFYTHVFCSSAKNTTDSEQLLDCIAWIQPWSGRATSEGTTTLPASSSDTAKQHQHGPFQFSKKFSDTIHNMFGQRCLSGLFALVEEGSIKHNGKSLAVPDTWKVVLERWKFWEQILQKVIPDSIEIVTTVSDILKAFMHQILRKEVTASQLKHIHGDQGTWLNPAYSFCELHGLHLLKHVHTQFSPDQYKVSEVLNTYRQKVIARWHECQRLDVCMRLIESTYWARPKLLDAEVTQFKVALEKHKQHRDALPVSTLQDAAFWAQSGCDFRPMLDAGDPCAVGVDSEWTKFIELLCPSAARQSTFHTVFETYRENMLKQEGVIEFFTQHVPSILMKYAEEISIYFTPDGCIPRLETIDFLWKDVLSFTPARTLKEVKQRAHELINAEIHQQRLFRKLTGQSEQFEDSFVSLLSAYAEVHNFEYNRRSKDLHTVADMFGPGNLNKLKSTNSDLASAVQGLVRATSDRTCSLLDLSDALDPVRRHTEAFDDQTWSLLAELAKAATLVQFIHELSKVNFDGKTLIDGAEQVMTDAYSVDAKTVRDFVMLQKFLKPLLKPQFANVEELLTKLVAAGCRQKDLKIDQLFKTCAPCAGALKRLHKSLANRGEMTAEKARGIVYHGWYMLMGPRWVVDGKVHKLPSDCSSPPSDMLSCGDLTESQKSRTLASINATCAQMTDDQCTRVFVRLSDKARALLASKTAEKTKLQEQLSELERKKRQQQQQPTKKKKKNKKSKSKSKSKKEEESLDNVEIMKVKDQLKRVRIDITIAEKDTLSEAQAIYDLRQLRDLKSRALLCTNPRNSGERTGSPNDMQLLESSVQCLERIVAYLVKLCILGNFKYRNYFKVIKGSELEGVEAELREALLDENAGWVTTLQVQRLKHPWLQYFRSSQLLTLWDGFRGGLIYPERHSFDAILRCITSSEQIANCPKKVDTIPQTSYQQLSQLGTYLDSVVSLAPAQRNAPQLPGRLERLINDSVVEPGRVFIAKCGKEDETLSALMILLMQEQLRPVAHQILFCNQITTSEELNLLLMRSECNAERLHCIVNPERLHVTIQFELVERVIELRRSQAPLRLALICFEQRNASSHVLGQITNSEHHTFHHVEEADLYSLLKYLSAGQDIFAVTSTHAGLGKTELIRQHSLSTRCALKTFHISGCLDVHKIVCRLATLNLRQGSALHLDIANVDDPTALNVFLFELLILKTVTVGISVYHLDTAIPVYIEIANVHNDTLASCLSVAKAFAAEPLTWDKSMKRFMFSTDILSAGQIVCNYLERLDKTIDSEDLVFDPDPSDNPDPSEVNVKPLDQDTCRGLLRDHFEGAKDPLCSFTSVHVFISVLAGQLRRFTLSDFFKTAMVRNPKVVGQKGAAGDVRSQIIRALIRVASSFAARSVSRARESQREATQNTVSLDPDSMADSLVQRQAITASWESGNHVLVIFQKQGEACISALYRDKSKLEPSLEELLLSQDIKLEEFSDKDQQFLCDEIAKIACSSKSKRQVDEAYAMTADNMLKMALVVLRIHAGLPVIIVGHSGCGKTSLLTYLAELCGVRFKVLNVHAGTTEETLQEFVFGLQELALEGEVWGFLDEINACTHLGLINDLICHRMHDGRDLHTNIRLMACANPYEKRRASQRHTAGLTQKLVQDQLTGLTYRVHPLPESMMDYVYDYGSLAPKEEPKYIETMLQDVCSSTEQRKKVAKLVINSQQMVRKLTDISAVSLRDVKRARDVILFFHMHPTDSFFAKRRNARGRLWTIYVKANVAHVSEEDCACILALALCYYVRLNQVQHRTDYAAMVDKTFTPGTFEAVLYREQKDILDRMNQTLYPNIAPNGALLENVFVAFVCILMKTPLFVVGKPGNSKSLSMQLLCSSLKGSDDSVDALLKKLPEVFFVSYQGSEDSTSEGIIAVFDRAKAIVDDLPQHRASELSTPHSLLEVEPEPEAQQTELGLEPEPEPQQTAFDDYNRSIPVVLLDEVGLAEVSRHNPLKVLHSLLEPAFGSTPDVAVVGISNWALDAAKMNRAVHLSRPEPDAKDLELTGKTIWESFGGKLSYTNGEVHLSKLANAYFEYYRDQTYANFHGLRDYYSLIKSIGHDFKSDSASFCFEDSLQRSLSRNFGGLGHMEGELDTLEKVFLGGALPAGRRAAALQLVRSNLDDPDARHLLITTAGDSALQIITAVLHNLSRSSEQALMNAIKCTPDAGTTIEQAQDNYTACQTFVMHGSKFELDQSGDYSYRVLSQIILCMEKGGVLILRDLDAIYGALYDMLNQNYVEVNGKRHCRVALGADSNPMCVVHDTFRCIVLVDKDNLICNGHLMLDPPFLNRFEKQTLLYSDRLCECCTTSLDLVGISSELEDWLANVSTSTSSNSAPAFDSQSQQHPDPFDVADAFLGYHENTIPSLVLKLADEHISKEHMITCCKEHLLRIATEDAVVRMAKICPGERQFCEAVYYRQRITSLLELSKTHIAAWIDQASETVHRQFGAKMCVMTYSSVHEPLQRSSSKDYCIISQVHLADFKSEAQFVQSIDKFWTSEGELFVVRVNVATDAKHVQMVRSKLEQFQSTALRHAKHVCIVLHVDRFTSVRAADPTGWQCDFLSDWHQVTIDDLHGNTGIDVCQLREQSLPDVLAAGDALSVADVIKEHVSAGFYCIKYPHSCGTWRPNDHIRKYVQRIRADEPLLGLLEERIMLYILESSGKLLDWIETIAWSHKDLFQYSTLATAVNRVLCQQISTPLVMLIFVLEKLDALRTYFSLVDNTNQKLLELWKSLFRNPEVVDISSMGMQSSYDLAGYNYRKTLQFPFSQYFFSILQDMVLSTPFEDEDAEIQRRNQLRALKFTEIFDEAKAIGVDINQINQDHGVDMVAAVIDAIIDHEQRKLPEQLSEPVSNFLKPFADKHKIEAWKNKMLSRCSTAFVVILANARLNDQSSAIENTIVLYMHDALATLGLGRGDHPHSPPPTNTDTPQRQELVEHVMRGHYPDVCRSALDLHICLHMFNVEIAAELGITSIVPQIAHDDLLRSDTTLVQLACRYLLERAHSEDKLQLRDWCRSAYQVIQHAKVMQSDAVFDYDVLNTCQKFGQMVCSISASSAQRQRWFKQFCELAYAPDRYWDYLYSDAESFSEILRLTHEIRGSTTSSQLEQRLAAYVCGNFLLTYVQECIHHCVHQDNNGMWSIIVSSISRTVNGVGCTPGDLEPQPEPELESEPFADAMLPCCTEMMADYLKVCFGAKVYRNQVPISAKSIETITTLPLDRAELESLHVAARCLNSHLEDNSNTPFTTLLCDLIQDLYVSPFVDEINHELMSDAVHQTLRGPFQKRPLQWICSVAYAKVMISETAHFVASQCADSQDSVQSNVVNSFMQDYDAQHEIYQSFKIWLLKALRMEHLSNMQISDLQHDSALLKTYPWIIDVANSLTSTSSIKPSPLAVPHKPLVHGRYRDTCLLLGFEPLDAKETIHSNLELTISHVDEGNDDQLRDLLDHMHTSDQRMDFLSSLTIWCQTQSISPAARSKLCQVAQKHADSSADSSEACRHFAVTVKNLMTKSPQFFPSLHEGSNEVSTEMCVAMTKFSLQLSLASSPVQQSIFALYCCEPQIASETFLVGLPSMQSAVPVEEPTRFTHYKCSTCGDQYSVSEGDEVQSMQTLKGFQLRQCDPGSVEFVTAKSALEGNWSIDGGYIFDSNRHKVRVKEIINPVLRDRYESYKKQLDSRGTVNGNEALLFHGCAIEALDSIAESGFDKRFWQSATGQWQRFGPGFYFSRQSSKAHGYPHSEMNKLPGGENTKTMLLCKVAQGKVRRTRKNLDTLKGAAPPGFDSVHGESSWSSGGTLHDDELVVYDEHAILPYAEVTYTFEKRARGHGSSAPPLSTRAAASASQEGCRTCGSPIDGVMRVTERHDQKPTEVPGFHPDYTRPEHGIRSMGSVATLVLDMLLHWSIGFATEFSSDRGGLTLNRVLDYEQYCVERTQQRWQAVKRLLDLGDIDVCVLMLDIISGSQRFPSLSVFSAMQAEQLSAAAKTPLYTKMPFGRDEWEKEFDQQMIQPRMGENLARIIDEFKMKRSVRILGEAILLEQQVEERNCDYPHHTLFRIVADKSKQAMQAALNETSIRLNFSFLNIFWEFEPHLHLIQHLLPLLRWANLIMLR